MRPALLLVACVITALPGMLVAQSSPAYRVSDAGMAAAAGHTGSDAYSAGVVGGDGSSSGSSSSPLYTMQIEPAGLPGPTGESIFSDGFE